MFVRTQQLEPQGKTHVIRATYADGGTATIPIEVSHNGLIRLEIVTFDPREGMLTEAKEKADAHA